VEPVPAVERPEANRLREMLRAYRLPQAIYVAAKLGLADLLSDGPRSAEELAATTGAHPTALLRLLRFLASRKLFAELESQTFGLTKLGATLRREAPDSLHGLAINTGEWWWEAYGAMLHSVTTGRSAHEHVYGVDVFEYFAEHSDTAAMFQGSSFQQSGHRARSSEAVAAAYDFASIGTLVDLGGGMGDLMVACLKANPHLNGVIYELPYQVPAARAFVDREGLSARCRVVGGNLFATVPPLGDAYMMRSVLHEFDDEKVLIILRNCRHVLGRGGRILVIERLMPNRAEDDPGTVEMDLEMLVMSAAGGLERTEAAFRAVFESAGFRLAKVVPTQSPWKVIEGWPA
jgi:O-methyltransferase domain/Dimerisation domain